MDNAQNIGHCHAQDTPHHPFVFREAEPNFSKFIFLLIYDKVQSVIWNGK